MTGDGCRRAERGKGAFVDPRRRARQTARPRQALVAAAVLMSLVLVGCGPRDPDPVAQPAPGVTTFEEGRFDNLPQYPRSEPLGPRHEKDDVVARSFKVRGASPDQILNFYRDALKERWRMVTGVEKLGVGTLRADWVDDEYRLRVSATRENKLDDRGDAGTSAAAQYSITLNPLPVGSP